MAKSKTVVTVISKISDRTSVSSAALVVIYGIDLGRKYELNRADLVVGRSSRSDIQIDQESISRSHCKFVSRDGKVTLQDLESTNGTFVNDVPVTEYELRNGDLIKVGRTIFKFLAGGNIESLYHEEIYRLTTVDGLTQVFNRRYFLEMLDREVSRCHRYGRSLALLMLDLDHFKEINDASGHLAGDSVLRSVASLLRSKIRREDVLCRYGGEEFAVIVPELDLSRAMLLAEKLRTLVAAHAFRFEENVIPVSISIGVAELSADMSDPQEFIKAADAKLYEAKASGRNCSRG